VSQTFEVSRNEEDDTFFVVDAFVGYRIPRRAGVISLEATNLLDSGFNFQDDNFRTSAATSELGNVRAPMYVPERAVFARLTLSF
jgi:outer membrane receptor protein involved in Fe transport